MPNIHMIICETAFSNEVSKLYTAPAENLLVVLNVQSVPLCTLLLFVILWLHSKHQVVNFCFVNCIFIAILTLLSARPRFHYIYIEDACMCAQPSQRSRKEH